MEAKPAKPMDSYEKINGDTYKCDLHRQTPGRARKEWMGGGGAFWGQVFRHRPKVAAYCDQVRSSGALFQAGEMRHTRKQGQASP